MRNYLPHYAKYGIPQPRYNELRNFCLQYPLWQAEAKSLLGVGAQRYSSMPHGSGVGDPVARAAEKASSCSRRSNWSSAWPGPSRAGSGTPR